MSAHTPRMFKHGHTFQNVEQEHDLNTHFDTLAEWWENAEQGTARKGDAVILRHEDGSYEVHPDAIGEDREHDDVRILARAPKPAWHDAVAVTADVGRIDGARRVFVKDENGVWIDALTGHGYTAGHLRDATPLIEQKVTEEARDRLWKTIKEMDWDGGETRFNMRADIERLLTAALGLETE